MTATLAQLIALTTFGNAYLQGKPLPEGFFPGNKAFSFCRSVDFSEFRRLFFFSKAKEKMVAATPGAWMAYLEKQECRKLRLYYQPSKEQGMAKDHQLAAFVGGGGNWMIEAVYSKTSIYWNNRWMVTHPDDPQQQIWTVNYGAFIQRQPITDQQVPHSQAHEQLQQALRQIHDFAHRCGEGNWAAVFAGALAALEQPPPVNDDFLGSVLPQGEYPQAARQLLAAARRAYVFGGMGSWNDISFGDTAGQEAYDQLSEALYSAITNAVISAVNTGS